MHTLASLTHSLGYQNSKVHPDVLELENFVYIYEYAYSSNDKKILKNKGFSLQLENDWSD